MRFAVVAHHRSDTNRALAEAAGGAVCSPREALLSLGRGDVALARLDVAETLDGIEPGLELLERLESAGVAVLNRPAALLAAHDKLLTARLLRRSALPHPHTVLLGPGAEPPRGLDHPIVLKPRFGSWGRDVTLCRDDDELRRALEELRFRPWLRSHGALLQELVPPVGHDLRVVVAAGRVVGAARRDAAPGEWRTNVALGGISRPADPPPDACRLAEAAAAAIGADLVGVDLLPVGGGHAILELNGAVDVQPWYAQDGDLAGAAVAALLPVVAGPQAA
ncbi:MAG TPA: ATP-grasp domain-containing protein [Gaiellaceae bacterium]|jgi:RimK family alpha-L-glutamate ligase